jgi:TonB family protein
MQMVWTPAPELAPTPLLPSPNILAVKLPEKRFEAPPPGPRTPSLAKIEMPDAPDMSPAAQRATELPSLRLPPRPYVAPPAAARKTIARVPTLDEAPMVAVFTTPGGTAGLGPSPRLPSRPFTAPSGRSGSAVSRSVNVDAPPVLDSPANSTDLNVAIVGLNPIDTRAPLPTASSPADFSAGPKVRPDGAASEGTGNGLRVPDLFVRGPREAKPDLLAQAYAAPTSRETIRAALNRGEAVAPPRVQSAPGTHDGAAKVANAPDPRFNGRDVYLMAIQMPNLTSYSGSWLMWYSGRTEREAGLNPLSAPVAHRKVDPKYIATAVEERVEGRVQLACVIDTEGKVSGVELVRGADPRLNQSAAEALAKWEFYPATRNGQPVAVDVLVEIPFKLAPRLPQPR